MPLPKAQPSHKFHFPGDQWLNKYNLEIYKEMTYSQFLKILQWRKGLHFARSKLGPNFFFDLTCANLTGNVEN